MLPVKLLANEFTDGVACAVPGSMPPVSGSFWKTMENLILFPNSLKSNHSASQTPPYRFPYYWPFTSGLSHLVDPPKNHTHTLYWYIVHETRAV